MKLHLSKNQRGFSHHFVLPIIAILAVAGIGSYVMLQSSSAAIKHKPICADNKKLGSSWKTCGTTYPGYYNGHAVNAKFTARVTKSSDGSRILEVIPKNTSYKFDAGKTTVKVDLINISTNEKYVSCRGKDGKWHAFKGSAGQKRVAVTLWKDWNQCFIWFRPTITQYGPTDGYVHKDRTNGPDDVRVLVKV